MSGFHLYDMTSSIDHDLQDGKTIIGRSTECDICVLSSNVSRKHAMLELADDRLMFSDLGSSNGSFVNGQQVKAPLQLHTGDKLKIGDFEFAVTIEGETAQTRGAASEEATQLAGGDDQDVPAMWSENAGLEQASGTQFFADTGESDAVSDYRLGKIEVPPLGDLPRLVGLSGDIRAQVFILDGDSSGGSRTWKIGRDSATVDLVVAEDSVSSQHAQLVNDGARWKIVNWMSTNGTFVNGQKGLSTYLNDGDVIRIGSAELAFELPVGWGAGAKSSAANNSNKTAMQRLTAFIRRLLGRDS